MKTSRAMYQPTTVEDAVALLAEAGEEGRVLAGGATLVALMNARLVTPRCLVSLQAIDELCELSRAADGSVRIGAMRRHRQTAFESDLQAGHQVVSKAAAQIANPPVRNMGTIGGSLGFADPAADYPTALVAANAELELAGPAGRRRLPIADYLLGWYETALEPGEIITAVLLPAPQPGSVGHYEKLCRVSGDFALAAIAVVMTKADDGALSAVRVAVGGCGGAPVRVEEAENVLVAGQLDDASVKRAGELLQAALDPVDDVRASAQYRIQVVPRLLRRALDRIVDRSTQVAGAS
ncbi:MAG: xanthine dehydrogenase family protein subunit M [Burkholderiaceae bacterium]